jgi:hypothetical protein
VLALKQNTSLLQLICGINVCEQVMALAESTGDQSVKRVDFTWCLALCLPVLLEGLRRTQVCFIRGRYCCSSVPPTPMKRPNALAAGCRKWNVWGTDLSPFDTRRRGLPPRCLVSCACLAATIPDIILLRSKPCLVPSENAGGKRPKMPASRTNAGTLTSES